MPFVMFVVGLVAVAAGVALIVAVDATAGGLAVAAGCLVAGYAVFQLYLCRPAEAETPPPPVGSQFLCPSCQAVVSIEAPACPDCGREFVDGVFQCPKCKASAPMSSEECPGCGFLFVEKEYGVCPGCRASIDLNATACPFCGERIWSALRPPMKLLACPSCRKAVKVGVERCGSCGHVLIEEVVPKEEPKAPPPDRGASDGDRWE